MQIMEYLYTGNGTDTACHQAQMQMQELRQPVVRAFSCKVYERRPLQLTFLP